MFGALSLAPSSRAAGRSPYVEDPLSYSVGTRRTADFYFLRTAVALFSMDLNSSPDATFVLPGKGRLP